MKTSKRITIGLCLAIALNACATKMSFVSSTIVPAATGKIVVKKDKNKNYVTDVHVANLADPGSLTPSRQNYLVWMETDNGKIRKMGQLMPSGKTLEGTLRTTSVAKPDEIFITAEDNTDVQNPEGKTVLTTKR